MHSLLTRLVLLCLWLVALQAASACPAVDRLPDFNCDKSAKVVIIGDSLVFGIGDSANDNQGGYVLRTQNRFTASTITGYGVPGLRTATVLKMLRKGFANPADSKLAQDVLAADLVVFDVGRNDRWLFGLPSATLRNLKRARSMIEKTTQREVGSSPLVVTAVLMNPNRGSQGPWVKELSGLILESHTPEHPADLRFDLVSKRLLSGDNIHPTAKGYSALAKVFIAYLLKEYGKYAALLRADGDNDGLYDSFEQARFGTSPTNPDSDGDVF
jgi:lysophospholipase L1-like esterase